MLNRYACLLLAGLVVCISATPGLARPKRLAQTCSGQPRHCKPMTRRLVPCANDRSRLCLVMRGDQDAPQFVAGNDRTITWQPVEGATYYRVTVMGYQAEWQSEPLLEPTYNYANLPLKAGNAYLVRVIAYGPNGTLKSFEQAINVPVQITANFQ